MRYCSLGRHWPFSKGNSGDGAGTRRLSVRICERPGATAAEDPCAASAPAAASGALSLLKPPPTWGGEVLPVNQGQDRIRDLSLALVQHLEQLAHAVSILGVDLNLLRNLPSMEGRRAAATL